MPIEKTEKRNTSEPALNGRIYLKQWEFENILNNYLKLIKNPHIGTLGHPEASTHSL